MSPPSPPPTWRRRRSLLVIPALLVALVPAGPATAAPTTARTALAWGYNNAGTLGDGSTARVWTPSTVAFPVPFASVAVGRDHAVAVDDRGRVWSWGRNDHGQLGDGTSTTRLRPVRVQLPRDVRVTRIAVAEDHALALTSAGRVYTWGANGFGQLGDGTRSDRRKPVRIALGAVSAIGAGRQSSFAAPAAGGLRAWGHNGHGQLGDGSRRDRYRPVAVALPGGSEIAEISGGDATTVVRTAKGAVLAWGDNRSGMVGVAGAADRPRPVPVRLPAGVRARAVDTGGRFAVALGTKGEVLTWGGAAHPELGRSSADPAVPGRVPLPQPVRQVSAGGSHVLALTENGQVWAWGENRVGQLGDGHDRPRPEPSQVALPAGHPVTAVAAGASSSYALTGSAATSPRLRLDPATARVEPGEPVTYTVTLQRGPGGPEIRPGDVRLQIDGGGTCRELTCRATSSGRHTVTVRHQGLRATAVLDVVANSTTIPAPSTVPSGPATTTGPGAAPGTGASAGAEATTDEPNASTGGPAGSQDEPPAGSHGLLARTGASLWLTVAAVVAVVALLAGSTLLLLSRRHHSQGLHR